MNRVSAPVTPPSRTTTSRLITTNYSSNLAWSQPPKASLNSLDHSLQVYLQTYTITTSKCIFKLPRSQPPSISTNSLDYGLQVCMIMAPSRYLNLVDHSLQAYWYTRSIAASKFARSRFPNASPNSHDQSLYVMAWLHMTCPGPGDTCVI
jgi:hypothetical protein